MNDRPSWMNRPSLEGIRDPIRTGPPAELEGRYVPYKSCQPGAVLSFELVRARPDQFPGCEVPYFQPIVPYFLGDTQLALCCPSISLTVFLEGERLTKLRALLRARRIEAFYEWDHIAPLFDPEDAVITLMRIEFSGDVGTIRSLTTKP